MQTDTWQRQTRDQIAFLVSNASCAYGDAVSLYHQGLFQPVGLGEGREGLAPSISPWEDMTSVPPSLEPPLSITDRHKLHFAVNRGTHLRHKRRAGAGAASEQLPLAGARAAQSVCSRRHVRLHCC